MNLFLTYLWRAPQLFFAISIIVIFSVTCHEFCHAWCALKVGDPTAADAGHLTFNPFRQMGWFSLAMLLLAGICWGQVPVNPARMRGRHAPALVAAAGPLANLALAFVFVILTYAAIRADANDFARGMLFYASENNFVLFVFNLLPIPGLDGFAILHTFFPRFLENSSETVRGAIFVLVVLALVFIDSLFRLARLATALLLTLIDGCCG